MYEAHYVEKSVGTTEFHYCTKKREHSFSILKAFFRTTLVRVDALFIASRAPASGFIFRFTFRSLSDVSYSDECRSKKGFSVLKECSRFFVLHYVEDPNS